jgi:hypothetical protein
MLPNHYGRQSNVPLSSLAGPFISAIASNGGLSASGFSAVIEGFRMELGR